MTGILRNVADNDFIYSKGILKERADLKVNSAAISRNKKKIVKQKKGVSMYAVC